MQPGYILSNLFNTTIFPFILGIWLREFEKRHPFFEWLIAILPSGFLCLGTVMRVLQMSRDEWHPHAKDISIPELDYFFAQSLCSWVACIIVDGRHTVNICRAYGEILLQSLWQLISKPTFKKTFEFIGLLMSCISMLKFADDVYGTFQYLTDDVTLYTWFFLAVFFKISRIFLQGLMVLADAQHDDMVYRQHRTLTKQLLFTSVFLLIQVLFLAQFTPKCWFSWTIALLVVDIIYRAYQCCKIAIGMNWVHRRILVRLFEFTVLLSSCIAVLTFAANIYNTFQNETLYAWFFLPVFFNVTRILLQGLEVEGIMYRCFNTTNLLVGNTMYSVYNASKNWYYYRTRVRQETAPHYPCCIHIIWNQIHVHFYEKLPCKTTYFIPEQKSRYIEAVEETPKPDMCKCSEFTRKRERDEVISYSLPFSGLAEENNKE